MIRHAKVKMRWPSRCNSEEFDAACQAYDKAEIVKPSKKPRKIRKAKVFISDLDRTRWTAEGLFRDTDFTVLGDIREVKMNSFYGHRAKASSLHLVLLRTPAVAS